MLRFLLPVCLAVTALAPLAGAQQFVRDAGAFNPASPNTWTNGVEIADLDGDGDYDLVFANGSSYGGGGAQPQRLYLNNGSGNFQNAQGQLNVANFNAQMVIAEDIDLDGDLDLVFAPEGPWNGGNTTQRAKVLINDGTANFTDESNARMPATTMASFCVAGGDIDNDGDTDLVFTDGATFGGVATQHFLFLNDGTGFFTDVTGARMPADTYNAQDVTIFDFDGDFDLDIALSGKGQTNKRGRLYLNDGNGFFTIDNAMNQLGSGNTYEIDWADFDGDGDWDASVQSISSVSEGWGRNNGPGVQLPEVVYSGGNGQDDNEMGQLDYDNDGDLDAWVGSLGSSQEKVYNYNSGTGVFTRVNNLVSATNDSTLDIGFRDLDGDGDHDFVTAQGESGTKDNNIFDNNGPADTLPPTLLNIEIPGAVTAGGMVFRLHMQDAIVDDGKTNATASFTYTTFAGGSVESSGAGDAFHMGGAMYRAFVPTTGATDGVSLTWNCTDDVGNAATPTVIDVGNVGGVSPFTDLGLGKTGTNGVPVLAGSGPLTAGSSNSLDLSSALGSTTTTLVAGINNISAPFKGGTLVPSPDILVAGLPTTAGGTQTLPFTWPAGIPAGTLLYFQHWIVDGGATSGLSASNGLEGEAQ